MQFLEKMMYLKKVILLAISLYSIKLYKCQLTYFPEDRSLSVKCGALSSDLYVWRHEQWEWKIAYELVSVQWKQSFCQESQKNEDLSEEHDISASLVTCKSSSVFNISAAMFRMIMEQYSQCLISYISYSRISMSFGKFFSVLSRMHSSVSIFSRFLLKDKGTEAIMVIFEVSSRIKVVIKPSHLGNK